MRRYLSSQKLEVGKDLILEGELYQHIHKVCRQAVGDRFELMNADCNQAFLSEVVGVDKKSLKVNVLQARTLPDLPKPYIHLVLSFPKPKVFEAVLEKSVELGVKEIHPVVSDFSFFQSASKVKGKAKRWEKIVNSAMEQSARFEPMKIHSLKSLDGLLESLCVNKKKEAAADLLLAFYEGDAQLLSNYLNSAPWPVDLENIWVFVGAEGGFSHAEVQNFQRLKIPALSLGEQVLRVETACVSIVSVLRYISSTFKQG